MSVVRSTLKRYAVCVTSMALVIALSNYLVQFPIGDWLTLAAFSYPLCFLVTDISNRFHGVSFARRVVFFGFAFGALLSVMLATPRIAVASGTAFLVSQWLDVMIFNRLRQQIWWKAPLFSSACGSIVDTALFFGLAFAFTNNPWVTLAAGDFLAKAAMFLLLLPVYRNLVRRLSLYWQWA